MPDQPKAPVPPPISLDDDDEDRTAIGTPDFGSPKAPDPDGIPLGISLDADELNEPTDTVRTRAPDFEQPAPKDGAAISLDDEDDEERTQIEKRPGPPR